MSDFKAKMLTIDFRWDGTSLGKLFGVLAVVLTLCYLNHIRLLTNY